jgi:hypothetical protein
MVHPKGKELSLVAKAFLDFALKFEPQMRARLLDQWPELADDLNKTKPAAKAARKKKSTRKKKA